MPSSEEYDVDVPASRRAFVAQLGLGGLALAATACAAGTSGTTATAAPTPAPTSQPPAAPTASATPAAPSSRPGRSAPPIPIPPAKGDGPWDMSWLERVASARFKLIFDIGAYQDGGGLYYAKNYLNGMRDGWEIETPNVLAVLGISGDAYPIVFNDTIWEKYKYGESSKTTDVRTGQPAVRNVWWQPRASEPMAEYGVDVLQTRGAAYVYAGA